MFLRKVGLALLGGGAIVLFSAALFAAGPGRLAGSVVDEGGQPVPGAAVTITTPKFPSLKIELVTDGRGHFETPIDNTTPEYILQAQKAGFAPTQTEFKVPSGGTWNASVTLHPPINPPPTVPKVDPAITAYNDGVELLQRGDKAGAEKKFQEAVAAKPDLASAWKVLAEIAYERKDYAKALAYGKKCLDADPTQKDLYGLMMESAEKTGDASTSEYKKKYREANADKPEVNYNAGVESYNANDYSGAAAYFSKALQLKPDLASAYFWLAMCEYNQKKFTQSKADLEKYLQLAPQGDQAATAREMLSSLQAK
jgi:TolA-binding protein